MIGFFDSGFGGLTILKEVAIQLPEYDYLYLGDNARTPYGSHSSQVIYDYTVQGVEALFARGAELVILACNTASAVALRRIQQQWLPKYYPDKKVLGIIIPVTEQANSFQSNTIGYFATQATVDSEVFESEIAKINPALITLGQACPLLVPIIESGEFAQLDEIVQQYVKKIFDQNNEIGTVILGCTHYAIIENIFRKYIPQNVEIISQAKLVTESLADYLERHPELDAVLTKNGHRIIYTTEDNERIEKLARIFYGDSNIKLEVVKYE